MKMQTVYVYLLDEGSDAWAPVEAQYVTGSVYRIVGHRNADEKPEFAPGDLVHCRLRAFTDGEALVAYARAS